MKLLFLGGTQFCGRWALEQAVDAGHEVTLLHRGSHAQGLPEQARSLVGDRDPALGDGLAQLASRIDAGDRWDAVIDLCGYVPRVVRASAELLEPACGRYVFVSTISVYASDDAGERDESAALRTLEDPDVEDIGHGNYGGLKVLCERAVASVFGRRAVMPRPGLIVGPRDTTDRFTYWTRRLAEGGDVLVPAFLDCPTRWIDARDLAAFLLRLAQSDLSGPCNALAPPTPIGFRAFLERIVKTVGGPDANWIERDDAWLEAHDVIPFRDMPAYTGPADASLGRLSAAIAFDAGLHARSLEETTADTRAWDVDRGLPELKAGLSAERERALLAR